MDEFLSEKEQIERIRGWWRDNGWYIVGGALLGAALLFGMNRYEAHREQRAEEAAAIYQELKAAVDSNNREEASRLHEELRRDYDDSPYADHAALLIARAELIRDPQRAADELRHVMETSEDEGLAMIARLRLARVLAYRESYQEALQLLSVSDPGPFAARINEIRGDIYTALGETEAARAAYLQALAAPAGELVNRSYVQIKLDALPSPATQPPAAGDGS